MCKKDKTQVKQTYEVFSYRFVMVVRKNVLEYIIALVVVKNKVRSKKFQI